MGSVKWLDVSFITLLRGNNMSINGLSQLQKLVNLVIEFHLEYELLSNDQWDYHLFSILNEKEERIITFRFDRQGTFLEKLI